MTDANRYGVRIENGPGGWLVLILDPAGQVALQRPCADETEAHVYASTVRQHVYWLSEDRFRRYYRLSMPQEA